MNGKPKLNCKLIVSDFDGTLANSDNLISEKNIRAINRYVSDGGVFAVCTGRILPSILPRIKPLGLKGLLVACQGAVVADIETGKIIRDIRLDSRQSAEICAEMEQRNLNVEAFADGGFYTDIPDGTSYLSLYENITGIRACHEKLPVSAYLTENDVSCYKISTLCPAERQAEIYGELVRALGDKYGVTCSASVLIEVCPAGEDKGTALQFLADHYGVPHGLTCAVGDNLNDLPMLRSAGYGIAVANASDALKEQADAVTVSNDEDAVARVIEEYGYAL